MTDRRAFAVWELLREVADAGVGWKLLVGNPQASASADTSAAVTAVQSVYPDMSDAEADVMLDRLCDVAEAAEGSQDRLVAGLALLTLKGDLSNAQALSLIAAAVGDRCPQYRNLLE